MTIAGMSLLRHIGKSAITLGVMLFLLSIVVFFASRLAPGDPLQSFFGDATQSMSAEELEAARRRLGLDDPFLLQYGRWLTNILHGDFGISLRYKRPVLDVAAPLIGNTLILGGSAYGLVFVLALALALVCARFEDTPLDRFICRAGIVVHCIPAFWMGVVLILVFSVNLRWFPSGGAYGVGRSRDALDRLRHMILPVTVMVMSHLWHYAYMIRNKLLDEVRKDYVLLARSKGLGRLSTLVGHCLRNVLPTIVGVMAVSIPHVLGGGYVAETVFSYPGIGLLAVSSVKYHDYNPLMFVVLITGALVIVGGLAAQTINEIIDPRMKVDEGIAA